jgi:hypothetical protein
MKLRIRGNSIRLRLGRTEVLRMLRSGIVVESTTFDLARRQRLEYALESTADSPAVSAAFQDGRVVVRVPRDLVLAWGTTDQIGISATQSTSDGGVLKILIEKDLECIDAPAEESQEDTFARPDCGAPCSSTNSPNERVEIRGSLRSTS